MEQKISLGRIVLYALTPVDAEQIRRRRTSGASIADRIQEKSWPTGAQAHIGNSVAPGDTFPMVVVRQWGPDMVNGQVLLDGNDVLWVTSVHEGPEMGNWRWPPRV